MTRRALILVLAVLCGGLTLAPAAQAHAYLQGDYYATLQDALGDLDNQLDALFTMYTGCPSWSTTCTGTYGVQTAVHSLVVGQNGPSWDGTADHGATISPAWAYSAKGVNDWKSFTMLEEVLRTDTCLAGIGLSAVNTIRSTFASNLAKPMPEITVMGVRVRADVQYVIGITLDTYANITTGATNTLCESVTLIGNTCFDVAVEPLEQLVDSANPILDDTVRNMTASYMTIGDYRGVYYWKSFMGRLAFSFIKELLPGLLAAIGKSDDGSVYIPTDNPGEALMAVVYMALAQATATMEEGGDDKASQVCPPWGTVNDMHLDWTNGLPQRIDFTGGNVQNPQIDIMGTSLCTAVTNFANNYDIGAGKYAERNQYLAVGSAVPNQGNLNRDTGNTELNKASYDAVGGDVDAWLKREGARLDFFFTQQPAGPVAAPAFMGTHTFNAGASAPTSVAMYWYYSDNGVDWTLDAGGASYTPTFNFYSFGGDVVSRQYQARAVTDCAGTPYTLFSNIITVNNVTPPPITFSLQPPATTSAVPGQVVTMPATATCAYGFITYQWQKWDGAAWQNVAGATNATLNLGSVNAGMAGQYRCMAYNQITTKGVNPVYFQASNPATLNVAPDIVISPQPLGGDFAIGASHTMTVGATVASGTLSYQWQRNVGFGFQNISGQIGTSLALTGMTVNNAGSYRCIVTNTHPTYGVYSLFSASAVVNVSSGFVAFVDPTSPGPQNGLTWATAFHTMQPAVNLANAQPSGGEVWVAGGTQAVPIVYNEARTEAWGAPSSVAGSLVMKDNVAVYGGFEGYRGGAGKLEANRRDRNRWQNVTTIAAPAGAYHVVVFGRQLAATLNSTLDGFIIQGGNAAGLPGDYHTWRGGGIFNWQSTPTIANCVVAGNLAATSGGGIANISSGTLDANAALMNVIVTGNTANRLDDGYLGGSPMRGGGGIFNDGASPNLTWVTVLSNAIGASASPFGAAGAGMYSFVGSPSVSSSIFWANTGGMSQVEDNTTFGDLSASTITYSDANLTAISWAGDGSYTFPLSSPAVGVGNIYADPALINWFPQVGSPVIDTADPMLMGDDITAAIRPVDGDAVPGAISDMGAVEWVHAPSVACLSAALNISLQTTITDPLTLFDGTNSVVEGGIFRLEVAANTFGCAQIPGPTPVRVTVYDNRGQSGFCDAPVSAFETTNPVVVTNTITRQLNGSGSYALTNADVQALGAGSTDNCGINWAASSVTPSTLTCAALGGPVNVTLTVVDTSGNSASGTAQVVMQDNTAPVAVGATISVNLDIAGTYTLSSGDMQALGAGSTDNCSINSSATTATPTTFTCANLGANSVTVTVYDTSGNSATATGTVNVNDATPPIISGVSPKSFVTPGPDFASASALAGVTAADGCAGAVAVTVQCRDALNNLVAFPIPDTFPTGGVYPYTFTLNYSAPDGNGNTATQSTTLTLQNNTPPVITITGGTPVSVQCGTAYVDQGATAADAESGDLTGLINTTGLPVNTGSVGSATVTYSVVDPVTGVTVTRNRIVNIIDTTAPTVVGNPITRALVGNAYSLSAADIQAMGAGSSDSCGGINWATSTASPSSFTCANVGTPVNVTLTLRDNAGNSASATVQVTITDTTQPVIAGVSGKAFRTPGPDFTSAQALSGVSVTDNCATGLTPTVVCRDASNVVVPFPVPDTYPTGGVYPYTFTLTYTANDGNGNTQTATASLVLTQNLPPVITVVGANPATVECGATYTDSGATVDDPDDADPVIVTTGLPVSTTSVGSATVTYQATDVVSGVVVTRTRTVNIVDTTGPTVVTNNITRNLPVSNTYTITLADRQAVGAGSTDSCGTIDWAGSLITPGTFTCANVGANNVTITVRDSNGNTRTGNAVITIVDATPPVISGVSNKAFMTPGPDFTLAQALSGVTAADTCTGNRTANVTVVCRDALNNVVPFPVNDLFPTGGVYPYIFTLTYTVTDGNGNNDTETANLTLTNDNPPVITIVGANPATVQCGSAYVDSGATASDVESGSLTVTTTGLPVNTSAVASANVGYSATDPVTGVVVTATRTVNIVDTTAPAAVANPISVTLVGNAYSLTLANIQTIGAGSSDACGGIDWNNSTVVPSSFTCANVGSPVNVTLTVRDTAGLTATAATTVTVLDSTLPVLAGVSNKAFRTPGADFTLASALSGVTATDNCATGMVVSVEARDALNNVVAFPVPDTYPTGGVYPYTFTLNYSVSDGNGNTATQTANLVLTQNLPPAITVLGSNPATVECGAVYSDAGATVSDPDDGAPVLNTTGLPINTSSPNTFTVTYSATDVASGVEVTATRTVNVVDTTGPSVTTTPITRSLSSGAYTVTVADRQAIAAGATDSCGTIDWNASRIIPGTFSCANIGANTVEVRVVDSNGNMTVTSGTLTIADVNAPVISGVSDKAFMTPGPDFTSAQALAGVSATDVCDGARTVNVECRNALNVVVAFPVPDTYPTGGIYPYVFTLTYTSSDTSGNLRTQVANLTLTDDNPPVITILGANPATVECGTSYTDEGATAADVESGNLTGQISAAGLPIPTGTPGTYAVLYSVTDPLTAVTVSQSRQVDVVDTTPPTLTLFGSAVIGVATGGVFTDPGYTASDSCAGDLTGSVAVGGATVNTAVPGTYVVTYNVTDGYNAAPERTRTVIVTNLLWFSTQPVGGTLYTDEAPITLAAVFEDGLNPSTYQWFVATNGGAEQAVGAAVAVPGDRTLTLTVNPAVYGVGTHVFVVRVTDDTGVRSSASATVVVGPRMSVTDGLENETLTLGADFTWSIAVTGGIGTLNYQWLKDDGSKAFVPVSDGAGITGSTTTALVITGFTGDMVGDYQVEVSDDYDTITVGPASLSLGSGVPAAGGLGLAALAVLTALGGAMTIRRRK